MASSVVIPYAPRPLQQDIHDQLKRWSVVVCNFVHSEEPSMIDRVSNDRIFHDQDIPVTEPVSGLPVLLEGGLQESVWSYYDI